MMGNLAEGFTMVTAFLIAIIFAVIRGIMFFRKRSAKNLQACLASVFVFPLFFLSFFLVSELKRWGMPIPKTGIWDPSSNNPTR